MAAIDDFSSTIVSFDMLIADTEVKTEPEQAFHKNMAPRKIEPISGKNNFYLSYFFVCVCVCVCVGMGIFVCVCV